MDTGQAPLVERHPRQPQQPLQALATTDQGRTENIFEHFTSLRTNGACIFVGLLERLTVHIKLIGVRFTTQVANGVDLGITVEVMLDSPGSLGLRLLVGTIYVKYQVSLGDGLLDHGLILGFVTLNSGYVDQVKVFALMAELVDHIILGEIRLTGTNDFTIDLSCTTLQALQFFLLFQQSWQSVTDQLAQGMLFAHGDVRGRPKRKKC